MNNRGFVVPVVIWVIVAIGGGVMVAVPNFRPASWFAKDKVANANAALKKADDDLLKAQKDAKDANDALIAAKASESARKDSQVRFGYQMTSGASEALKTAPASPQTALAQSLLLRANPAFAAAIGNLTQTEQDAIVKIVEDSLSGVQGKLDDANVRLAAMDKSLVITTSERDILKMQIPKLEAQVEVKTQAVITQTAAVAQKQIALVATAQKIQEEIKQSGSLTAQLDNLGRLLIVLGLFYVIAHYLLPSVAAEFPQVRVLQGLNRTITSFVSAHEITDQAEPPKV